METAAASNDHHNPFEVLELPATASGREVTRQKDKLLGMLELGLDRAKRYTSSVGDRERTADLVRTAAQELERPRSRLGWELWVQPSDEEVEDDADAAAMRRALVLHSQLLKETDKGIAFGVEELDELGSAWDEVFAANWIFDRIVARADELELEVDESEVFDELRDEVRNQLRTMFERGPVVDLDKLESELATEVAHEFADRKVELIELACSRISKTKLQQQQRRQQWTGLVKEYATTVSGRGDHLRRAAFQAMNAGIGELAVELFNDDIDHTTALSMFQWLRDEAHNLDDDGLHRLHGKNAATVQSRIQRDYEAIYTTQYQEPIRQESEWGAGRIIVVVIGLILALIRAGNGCDKSSTFEAPSYRTPRGFDYDSQRYRELLRNYEYQLPEHTDEPLQPYEGGGEPSLEHEPGP